MCANGEYMQSRRLRASNLSNRYNFEAGYDPCIYFYIAYFVYTLFYAVFIDESKYYPPKYISLSQTLI